jgi:deoxycytidylate deaminase
MSSNYTKQIVLGLTGPFGSGCSTLAKVLKQDHEYEKFCLSDFVYEKWLADNKGKKITEAPREELQAIGNKLRQNEEKDILARKAYSRAKDKGKLKAKRLVFDSIRNAAEIEYFRKTFPDFFLIAVDCVEPHRWMRVQEKYGRDYQAFREDDRRDKNEEGISYGQQVALCVDDADVLVRNDNDPMVRTSLAWEERLKEKVGSYLRMFDGEQNLPTEQEAYMSIAYCASLMSQCFKRQVGAVIVDEKNRVVSVGYNENPPPLQPCNKEFFDCFREMYIDGLMMELKHCPNCGEELKTFKYPYECPRCEKNIYRIIVRDRALSRCSALHAEERAIINAGSKSLNNCKMYVTTFPCFNCARKILDVGISTIWYVESYPDTDSLHIFERADTVTLHPFEGVKARAYFRLFSQWRVKEERRMLKKRGR